MSMYIIRIKLIGKSENIFQTICWLTFAELLRPMGTVVSACHRNWIIPPAASTRSNFWVDPPTSYVIQFINRYYVYM